MVREDIKDTVVDILREHWETATTDEGKFFDLEKLIPRVNTLHDEDTVIRSALRVPLSELQEAGVVQHRVTRQGNRVIKIEYAWAG